MSSLIFRNLHHLRSSIRAFSPTYHNLHFLQIHPFSSSSSLKTTPNQHSFTVNYLINSCGFPLEKALSASKYVNFETPHKPDAVLAFFENHGFTKTQISILVRKLPPVIVCDPEKTLLPKLEFFKSKGVSSTDVAKILSSSPAVLKRSLENHVIPSFNFLKKLMGSEAATISAIKRSGRLLLLDLQIDVAPNIEFLRESGVPNENILVLLRYQPRVFMTSCDRFREIVKEVEEMGFNPLRTKFVIAIHAFRAMSKSTWEKKVEVYKKWGLSEDDILVAFGKRPWCMIASEHKISGASTCFAELREENCSKDISLTRMLVSPENWFLNRVVYRHKEEAPKLLKLYKEKNYPIFQKHYGSDYVFQSIMFS
ncbi:hypothetical protein CsSME_00033235 [Camellia sinensis var. sinensis]